MSEDLMQYPNPIYGLIAQGWQRRADLAEEMGVQKDRIDKWARRGVIPAGFLHLFLIRCHARGLDVTADDLLKMVADDESEAAA